MCIRLPASKVTLRPDLVVSQFSHRKQGWMEAKVENFQEIVPRCNNTIWPTHLTGSTIYRRHGIREMVSFGHHYRAIFIPADWSMANQLPSLIAPPHSCPCNHAAADPLTGPKGPKPNNLNNGPRNQFSGIRSKAIEMNKSGWFMIRLTVMRMTLLSAG